MLEISFFSYIQSWLKEGLFSLKTTLKPRRPQEKKRPLCRVYMHDVYKYMRVLLGWIEINIDSMALKRPAPFTVNDRSRYDQIGLLSIFAHEKHCSRSNKKTQNSSPDVWKGKKNTS